MATYNGLELERRTAKQIAHALQMGEQWHYILRFNAGFYTGNDIVHPFGGESNIKHQVKCAVFDRKGVHARGWVRAGGCAICEGSD